MILSDSTIREYLNGGRLRLHADLPLALTQLQPASIDLCLGAEFRVLAPHGAAVIEPWATEATDVMDLIHLGNDEVFHLHPGQFALATTMESVELPNDLVAQVMGKSSLGRWGLMVHATAGFVDPGFRGQITLELSNVATVPIALRPWMLIAQLAFTKLDRPAERPYGSPGLGSHYQDQEGVVASRSAWNGR